MTVRAVFFVKQINHLHNGMGDPTVEVVMGAAFGSYLKGLVDDKVANQEWSKYTPSGELKIMITNPPAIEQFELGAVYTLDFNRLEKSDS